MNSSDKKNNLVFRPIGIVHTEVEDKNIGISRKTDVKSIEIFNEFAQALNGIEEYSNIFVLFWMAKNNHRRELTIYPRGNTDNKKVGTLAYRGRNHPNPIGLAVCDLIERRGNILQVLKLDAYNGTIIIDIKPYDDYDIVLEPSTPSWFKNNKSRGK